MIDKDLRHIAAKLRPLAVAVRGLKPDPENENTHDERSIAAIAVSLKEHGQIRPVVARRPGRIICIGHGMVEAAKRLGWKKIAAIVQPMTEDEHRLLRLRDNQTGNLSRFDATKLATTLKRLTQEVEVDPETLGFTMDQTLKAIASLEAPQVTDPKAPSTRAPSDHSHARIIQLFLNEQTSAQFAKMASESADAMGRADATLTDMAFLAVASLHHKLVGSEDNTVEEHVATVAPEQNGSPE